MNLINHVALHADDYPTRLINREEIYAMNNQMGSALPTEKLDRTNYTSWEYKMHPYLIGQGYWSYIQGARENQPDSTHANYPAWEQAASRVMYCLASCVHDHMLGYIRDSKTPNEAWEKLKKIFTTNTTAVTILHYMGQVVTTPCSI